MRTPGGEFVPPDRPAPLEWDDARAAAHGVAAPVPPRAVPLAAALGGVLAEPVRALVAIPPVDCSAMDGYAVCGEAPWTVVGSALAGGERAAPLRPGTACEIATGAPVPAGTLAVLPYENSRRVGTLVTVVPGTGCGGSGHCDPGAGDPGAGGSGVGGPAQAGKHVRRAGEECAAGDEVLAPGGVLGPAAVGLAAALGHDHLLVRPMPRVCALVTGDEVIENGPPVSGRVRDAIGPMLPGLTAWAGGRFDGVTRLADSAPVLKAALAAAADAELVLVSGSSSRGPADHLRPVLLSLGARLVVDGVRCRPGHPQAMARLPDGRLVVGLPGNPLAAFVAFLTLALPAITGLRGLALAELPAAPAPLAPDNGGRGERGGHGSGGQGGRHGKTRLVPVRVRGGAPVELAHAGSAMLRGLAAADAIAVVTPDGRTRLHPLP
ncbi:MAG TPA: molybdopterin molybdotransferase MoeA [Pseudonocardia sp.]|nr:molybdopterin molybdotransferase MoeA [Pseudonocardia sp.]